MFHFLSEEKLPVYFSKDGNDRLLCPNCRKSSLHQTTLQVIANARKEEDPGIVTTVTAKGKLTRKILLKDNVETYRDTLYIDFWGENCGKNASKKILELLQLENGVAVHWRH